MLVQIYEYSGHVTRSVATARLVAEVEVDELPEDELELAREYGGDFIEILELVG